MFIFVAEAEPAVCTCRTMGAMDRTESVSQTRPREHQAQKSIKTRPREHQACPLHSSSAHLPNPQTKTSPSSSSASTWLWPLEMSTTGTADTEILCGVDSCRFCGASCPSLSSPLNWTSARPRAEQLPPPPQVNTWPISSSKTLCLQPVMSQQECQRERESSEESSEWHTQMWGQEGQEGQLGARQGHMFLQ